MIGLLLAGALVCWPEPAAPRRLVAALRTPAHGRDVALSHLRAALRRWRPTPDRQPSTRVLAVGAVAALGAVLAGPGGAVAAVVLGVVGLRTSERRRRAARRVADGAALADGLGGLAAELRSGAPPDAAARSAARDGAPASRQVLDLVAATASLGGDVPAALRRAASVPAAPPDLHRVADAWALAERHGVGLAALVEAAAGDARARARFAGRLRAQVAGPRATAAVLAALPVLGLGLGTAIGARPWSVLSAPGAGQLLLVVGVLLVAAGVEWTERIVAGVTR